MLNRTLTYFLLILIVLQSGMALGDAHRLDQSPGAENVAHDENHQHLDAHTDKVGLDGSSTIQSDCHHCCHSHLCAAILMTVERISMSKSSAPLPDYSENTFPDTFEAFLRPPRA